MYTLPPSCLFFVIWLLNVNNLQNLMEFIQLSQYHKTEYNLSLSTKYALLTELSAIHTMASCGLLGFRCAEMF